MNFSGAMSELTTMIVEKFDFDSWRQNGYAVVFNLTGGFKSVNSFLQALGMLVADSCVFLFETSDELLEIPRLPIKLNLEETLEENFDVFRRLKMGYTVKASEIQAAPESLFTVVDDEVMTSVWGEYVWASVHKELFAREVIRSPLSVRVRYHDRLRESFKQLEAARRVDVNEALDEFCAYLDIDRPLLKSRTFKQLVGNPVPPSTHELYAWSDRGAGRLFGHWEGESFVFDSVDKHL